MPKHIVINGTARNICGWKPDRPDHRDRGYAFSLKASHLPPVADLRATGFLPRVEDQGQLGSCTMNASTSAMEFLYRKAQKPQPELSRLFGYYAERVKIESTPASEDSGAMIRDSMKSLMMYGVCFETTWPYEVDKFSVEPPKAAWEEALKHRITSYYRVTGLTGIRSCLAEGYPVVIGFSVPESMEGEETGTTGIVQYPSGSEPIVGGHAVLVVGYNDASQLLMFQNSWSTTWGDQGYGYLPYKFVTGGLASDFWTIRTEDF